MTGISAPEEVARLSERDELTHAGRRRRVRERLLAEGADAMAKHELLEFLLFYAIPKRDVNPLAHRLIERYGTLRGVLEADEAELAAFPGLGPMSAAYLKRLWAVVEAYLDPESSTDGASAPLTAARAVEMAREAFSQPGRQELCWISTTEDGRPLRAAARPLDAFTPGDVRALIADALEHGDSRLILVWKRLGRERALTGAEIGDLRAYLGLMSRIDIYLADLIIVYGEKVVSLREQGLLRDAE